MRRWPPLPRPPDLHAHHHHRSHRQRGGVHRIQREHRPRAARVVPQGGQGGVAGSGRQVGQGVGGGKRWRGGRRQEGGARHHPNHGAPHWKLASGARQRPLGRGSARPDRRRTRGRPQGGRAGGESEAAAAAPRSAAVGRGHGARPLARPPPPLHPAQLLRAGRVPGWRGGRARLPARAPHAIAAARPRLPRPRRHRRRRRRQCGLRPPRQAARRRGRRGRAGRRRAVRDRVPRLLRPPHPHRQAERGHGGVWW